MLLSRATQRRLLQSKYSHWSQNLMNTKKPCCKMCLLHYQFSFSCGWAHMAYIDFCLHLKLIQKPLAFTGKVSIFGFSWYSDSQVSEVRNISKLRFPHLAPKSTTAPRSETSETSYQPQQTSFYWVSLWYSGWHLWI